MTHVAVRNGNLDGALRKFKQKVARDGIPSEFKKREAYDKPGVKRREAKKAGIKNARKRERNNRDQTQVQSFCIIKCLKIEQL